MEDIKFIKTEDGKYHKVLQTVLKYDMDISYPEYQCTDGLFYSPEIVAKFETLEGEDAKAYEKQKSLEKLATTNETDNYVLIATIPCPNCGTYKHLLVNKNAYSAWRKGELLIQEAFPKMPKEDRERLITGICPECWKNLFEDEPEDSDEDIPF